MKYFSTIAFSFLFAVLLLPSNAQAVAVGVSPSTIDLVMFEDQTADVHYVLSRGESTGDFDLDVSVAQDPTIVTLIEGSSVTIPDGENAQVYPLVVTSRDLAQGSYEALVNFQEAGELEGEGVLAIRYGLQSKVKLQVVSYEMFLDMLRENPLELKGVYMEQPIIEAGDKAFVHYEIRNPSKLYVDKVTNVVQLLDGEGNVVVEERSEEAVELAPNENGVFEQKIGVDEPGEYSVRIQTLYDGEVLAETPVDVSVEERSGVTGLVMTIGIVVSGLVILLVVGGIAAGKKKK